MNKKVWIIGANSDVAKELILLMEKKYDIVAAVRNIEAMKNFIQKYKLNSVLVEKIDLNDKESIASFLKGKEAPDILIFAQGVLRKEKNVLAYLEEMVQCNYISSIEIIEAVWQSMLERKSGCIVGITSVAADRGKASNKLYSSTKAAFSSYLQALMQEGKTAGIQVLDIKPGYIRSKMLKHNKKAYQSPLASNPQKVADKILENIEKGKIGTVYIKAIWKFIMMIVKWLPEKIYVGLKI